MDKRQEQLTRDWEKAKATQRMRQLSGYSTIPVVSIPEIPAHRTLFPKTVDHYWKLVHYPNEDATGCIYELPPKGVFPPHLHEFAKESLRSLNEDVILEVVTFDIIEFLEHPINISFEKEVAHAVVNVGEVTAFVDVKWSPKMAGGWNANFLIETTPAG